MHIFKPWGLQGPPDPAKCRHAVPIGSGPTFRQCNFKAKVFVEHEGEKFGFCALHSPEESTKRHTKIIERSRARAAEWQNKWQLERMQKEAVDVLRRIAEGNNDPRMLAIEFFRQYEVVDSQEADNATAS